jgi:hypothetical protein
MLPTAYIDASTTNFCFCELFLAVPLFTCGETLEKIPTERLFIHKTVSYKRHISIWDAGWLAAFAFSVPASYHQAADMWPKPMTRLGSLLALHLRGRIRKLLLEGMALRAQPRRE